MTRLSDIQGVEGRYASQLRASGIRTCACLLEQGSTRIGRKQLAAKSGINADLLLQWIGRADLMRLTGVDNELADLLLRVGVDSVSDLSQRNARHLYQKIEATHTERCVRASLPAQSLVHSWVEQAKRRVSRQVRKIEGQP